MKKITLSSLFIIGALLLSSCSMHLGLSGLLGKGKASGTPEAKATHTPAANVSAININNGKYRPKNVTIKVGSTITWTNNGDKPETVTSDAPGVFDSGPIAAGATWQYTFSKEGTFPYHSTATSGTYGTITVVP